MNIEQIDEIERKITQSYRGRGDEERRETELSMQAVILVGYSEQYLAAAKAIEENHFLILPRLQMTGQALELLLKACIAGANKPPPHYHDLIKLSKECVALDYCISEVEIAWIIHLNQHYYKDSLTETKYKTRYPTDDNERVGGVCPEVYRYKNITNSLKVQIFNNVGYEGR